MNLWGLSGLIVWLEKPSQPTEEAWSFSSSGFDCAEEASKLYEGHNVKQGLAWDPWQCCTSAVAFQAAAGDLVTAELRGLCISTAHLLHRDPALPGASSRPRWDSWHRADPLG